MVFLSHDIITDYIVVILWHLPIVILHRNQEQF